LPDICLDFICGLFNVNGKNGKPSMKVECPNCRMVSAVKEDGTVTLENGADLSCPTCNSLMHLKLQAIAGGQDDLPAGNGPLQDPPAASDSTDSAGETQGGITALKAKILRGLVNLPPMPQIILKARDILSDPNSSPKELAKVIETDQAIVAKVLTLANSAYYGVSGMVSSIQHASVLLGQKTLGQMITISASSALLNKKLQGYGITPDEMWRHSLACAFAAKRIAEMRWADLLEDAFTAGLLHDAGKIILDPYIVKNQDEFAQLDRHHQMPLFEAEKVIIGFDHAEIMSRACRLWRFPEVQVAAIRNHHQPSCSKDHALACTIHLADVLAKSAGFTTGPPRTPDPVAPNILEFLKIRRQDLDDLATAMTDDIHKIKADLMIDLTQAL
jgi:HD-like signal output (HDOD) protein